MGDVTYFNNLGSSSISRDVAPWKLCSL